MKSNFFVLLLAILFTYVEKNNPNPSVDWLSVLQGFFVAGIFILLLFQIKIDRLNFALFLYSAVNTIINALTDKIDPFAFFLGFGLCSLLPILMMIGIDRDE